MREIFVHEDFLKMIEFLPKENYFSAARYIKEKLNDFKGDEYGFEDIKVIEKPKISLEEKSIKFKTLYDLLLPISSFYIKKVNSGYGSTVVYELKNTVMFGYDYFGIYASYNEEDIIIDLWMWDCNNIEGDGKNLLKALNLIGRELNLILIDWREPLLVNLVIQHKIENYLNDYTWCSIS